jgi:hypothetical protein
MSDDVGNLEDSAWISKCELLDTEGRPQTCHGNMGEEVWTSDEFQQHDMFVPSSDNTVDPQ